MSGVPESVLMENDHIQVRAPLVKLLGGANEALVWERIRFRTQHVSFAHENDGRQWWEANMADIGAEVGLSADQVKRALRRLVDLGFLVAERHSLPQQTMSYSPVIVHSAISPSGVVPVGDTAASTGRIRQMHGANSPSLPLYEESEEVEDTAASTVDDAFAGVWKIWPKKTDRKKALAKWRLAVKNRRVSLEALTAAATAHAEAYKLHHWPVEYVRGFEVWLNNDSWENPLPGPRTRGDERQAAALSLVAEYQERESRAEVGSGEAARIRIGS